MKKLLAILGSLGLVGMAGVSVVACKKPVKEITTESIKTTVLEEQNKIKDLEDLKEVNENLAKIKITGVKSLVAIQKDKSTTDVVVTITIDDNTHRLRGDKTFIVPGAISIKETIIIPHPPSEKGIIPITIKSIEDTIKNSETIKGVTKLDDLNKKLNEIKIVGVKLLIATLNDNSKTDVIVTVTIDETNHTLTGGKTFVIENAITIVKVQTSISLQAIKDAINNANTIKDLENLAEANIELAKIKIVGVISLTAELMPDSTKDIKVNIVIDSAGYILDGETSFVIENAINGKKKITIKLIEDAIKEDGNIKGLANLKAVNNKLADIAQQLGLQSLIAKVSGDVKTNVIVEITINETTQILIGKNSFDIVGAITNQQTPITLQEIKDKVVNAGTIVGLANIDEVNEKLIQLANTIDEVELLTAELIENSVNVQITVKTDSAYLLNGEKIFIIENAIAKKIIDLEMIKVKVEENGISSFPFEVAQEVLGFIGIDGVTLTAEKIEGSNNIKINVQVNEATHILNGDKSFIIEGLKTTESIELEAIQNNGEIQAIKNLKDLDEVKSALVKIQIPGVLTLEAELNKGSLTDVKITIQINEETHVLNGDNWFIIEGAIAKQIISLQTIQDAIKTKMISELFDLDAVNAKLLEIKNSISGITSLVAEHTENSATDVIVHLTIDENNYMFSEENKSFAIEGAIVKPKTTIETQSIENAIKMAGTINNLGGLGEVNTKLVAIQELIPGVISLTAQFINDSKTDVEIMIEINESLYKLDSSERIIITGAVKAEPIKLPIATIKDLVNSDTIHNYPNLKAINTKLKGIQIPGVTSLVATAVEGSETDVTIHITVNKAYVLVSEGDTNTFTISEAINKTVDWSLKQLKDIIISAKGFDQENRTDQDWEAFLSAIKKAEEATTDEEAEIVFPILLEAIEFITKLN